MNWASSDRQVDRHFRRRSYPFLWGALALLVLTLPACESSPIGVLRGDANDRAPEIKIPVEGRKYSGRVSVEAYLPKGVSPSRLQYSLDGGSRTTVPGDAISSVGENSGLEAWVYARLELDLPPGSHQLTLHAGGQSSTVGFAVETPEIAYRVDDPQLAGDSIWLHGLTDSGTILYSAVTGGVRSSYLRSATGSIDTIEAVVAAGINNSETVVGTTGLEWGSRRPFIWTRERIETIDRTDSRAEAVSEDGTVLVASGTSFGIYRDGQYISYGSGTPTGINDSGEVVYVAPMDPASAMITDGVQEVRLGGSKGTKTGAISERGFTVYSSAGRGASPYVGWLQNSSGELTELGTLYPSRPGPELTGSGQLMAATYPVDLNESNEVVGRAKRITQDFRGFLWLDGEILDLTSLVPAPWVIDDAIKINEAGDILAVGHPGRGEPRPVYLRRIRP